VQERKASELCVYPLCDGCFREVQAYKELSIISGTGAAIWLKLTLDLLATITLEVALFCAYAPFPALLPSFKCILEVTFCEVVQHRLQVCLDHLNYAKIATFQFYFQSGKQRKVEWVVMTVMLFFIKNSPMEKEVRDNALS
jgi:hypothetical protein